MQTFYERLITDDKSLILFREFILPRFESPLHYHDEYEILFMKEGSGKLYVGNQVINFDRDEVYFFAPGVAHCFYNGDRAGKQKQPGHAMVIHFRENFLGQDFFNTNEAILVKRLFKVSRHGLKLSNPSQELVKNVVKLRDSKGITKVINLLSILNELAKEKRASSISDSTAESQNDHDHDIITKVFNYVIKNFRNNISFSEAASVANMQKAAFCRYFKRKAKKKFSTFVSEIRAAHAQKLLAETDLTITEICYECGFNNLSYFNKQFKFFFGTAPKFYREQFHGEL